MAVSSGLLLDVVLSERTARRLVAIGCIYSILIALMMVFINPANNVQCPTGSCVPTTSQYSIGARTAFAVSVLLIIVGVTIVQIMALYKLRRRLNNAVGTIHAGQGLNRLYKRAMTKSALVAIAFTVGWGPPFVMLILSEWANIDQNLVNTMLPYLYMLGMIQGCCNAIIFRAKHIKNYIQQKMCC